METTGGTWPRRTAPRTRWTDLAGFAAVAALLVAAAFHAYWALGGDWAAAEAFGSKDLPPRALVLVPLAFIVGAILVLLGRMEVWRSRLPGSLFRWGTWALVAVFALVGAGNLAGTDEYAREWHVFFIGPLLIVLALLCAVVARGPRDPS